MDSDAISKVKVGRRKNYRLLWLVGAVLAIAIWLIFLWGKERKSWTEEVVLSGGRSIDVSRKLTLEKTYYELGQAGLKKTYQSIRFPDGVRFETKDSLVLMLVEAGPAPGSWTLIAAPSFCATFDKYQRPEPSYIQFDSNDGRWSYGPVDSKHFGKPANLAVSDKHVPHGSYLRSTAKAGLNSTWKGIAPTYLQIDPKDSLNATCITPTHGGKQ